MNNSDNRTNKDTKKGRSKDIKPRGGPSYARTYRHLVPNYRRMIAYLALFAVPGLLLLLFFYTEITQWVCEFTSNILSNFLPADKITIVSENFLPLFGKVNIINMPSTEPSRIMVIVNCIAIVVGLVICWAFRKKDKAKPITIFGVYLLLIHLASCLLFLFFPDSFPYTLSDYSGLYIKQTVGLWLAFFLIACLVTGGMGFGGLSKFTVIAAVVVYMFVFNVARYIIFLLLLYKASSIYMAVMFFGVGPFIDSLYLVSIYGIYMNYLVKKFNSNRGSGEWEWA